MEKLLSKVNDKIKEIDDDNRYHYPAATVFGNAPLALIQLELETKMRVLTWIKREIEKIGVSHKVEVDDERIK